MAGGTLIAVTIVGASAPPEPETLTRLAAPPRPRGVRHG